MSRELAAKVLRKQLEKEGNKDMLKALDNVLVKNKKMEDTPVEGKLTKQDLIDDALATQAKAIEEGKAYDKFAVAKIEAGDATFIEAYTSALRNPEKKKLSKSLPPLETYNPAPEELKKDDTNESRAHYMAAEHHARESFSHDYGNPHPNSAKLSEKHFKHTEKHLKHAGVPEHLAGTIAHHMHHSEAVGVFPLDEHAKSYRAAGEFTSNQFKAHPYDKKLKKAKLTK